MRVMKYRVYLEPDEDGVFVATCPALPGCVSQGKTRAEATANTREALEGYLKSLRKHGSHMILRHDDPPHRRLSVPNHKEVAKGRFER
jgi:antitoxin HicB